MVFIMPVYVQLRDSVTKNGSQSGAVLVSESRCGLSAVMVNQTTPSKSTSKTFPIR